MSFEVVHRVPSPEYSPEMMILLRGLYGQLEDMYDGYESGSGSSSLFAKNVASLETTIMSALVESDTPNGQKRSQLMHIRDATWLHLNIDSPQEFNGSFRKKAIRTLKRNKLDQDKLDDIFALAAEVDEGKYVMDERVGTIHGTSFDYEFSRIYGFTVDDLDDFLIGYHD